MISIREATLSDAASASTVLCASIADLCGRDHRGNPNVIDLWTRNKTPAAFCDWITTSEDTLYVAQIDGTIVAVGGIDSESSITLIYVAPHQTKKGVGKTMLRYLEGSLKNRGVCIAHLTSTLTARDFYTASGWIETGEIKSFLGTRAFNFEKNLQPAAG